MVAEMHKDLPQKMLRFLQAKEARRLYFDTAGNMFRGHLSDRNAFAVGEGGLFAVRFDLLKAL
jgi:hypothetical protein